MNRKNKKEQVTEDISIKSTSSGFFKRRIPVLILGILLVLTAVSISVYVVVKPDFSHKSKSEETFDMSLVKDLVVKDNQKVQVDDYTITLSQYLFEGTSNVGYCTFEIHRDGYDMRDEIVESTPSSTQCFGENKRFFFYVYEGDGTSGSVGSKIASYKATEDTLYLYYQFYSSTNNQDAFQNIVYLYDYNTNGSMYISKEAREKSPKFYLAENKKSITLVNKSTNTQIMVSPFSCRIEEGISDSQSETRNMTFYYKDSTKDSFITDGNPNLKYSLANSTTSSSSKNMYTYQFLKTFDYKKISYIILDDEKYVIQENSYE